MIDLHCHVLDETACGPESFDQSLEMCRTAVANGVQMIVATPSWEAGTGALALLIEKYRQKVNGLQQAMQGALTVKLGFILKFSDLLPDAVDLYGSQLALGGKRHLLISLPPVKLPAEVEEVWGHLERSDFLPVIAHPECHPALRRNPTRLTAWVSKGAILQIDAASLIGAHGRLVHQMAVDYLLKYRENVVVASHARRGRPYILGKARSEVVRQMGEGAALKYFCQTPTSIVYGTAADQYVDERNFMSRLTVRLRSSVSSQ